MTSRTDNIWFAFQRMTPQSRVRLFCFPYAGGGASVFRRWAASLPDWIDIFPLQLPGRENRFGEPLELDLRELSTKVAQAMQPLLDLPYAIWGHSLGGLLGFEVARCLRRNSQPDPRHLFISSSRAPHLPVPGEKTSQLADSEFIRLLRRFNGTPEAVLQEPELLQVMLPLLRADFNLVEQYSYTAEPPLGIPLSAWGGLQDLEINRQELGAWRSHTLENFSLLMFPGDHFFINTQQQMISEALIRELFE